jgi:hypothetical protein
MHCWKWENFLGVLVAFHILRHFNHTFYENGFVFVLGGRAEFCSAGRHLKNAVSNNELEKEF